MVIYSLPRRNLYTATMYTRIDYNSIRLEIPEVTKSTRSSHDSLNPALFTFDFRVLEPLSLSLVDLIQLLLIVGIPKSIFGCNESYQIYIWNFYRSVSNALSQMWYQKILFRNFGPHSRLPSLFYRVLPLNSDARFKNKIEPDRYSS